jgi:hypothetical protein
VRDVFWLLSVLCVLCALRSMHCVCCMHAHLCAGHLPEFLRCVA